MRYSQLFGKTQRLAPKDEVSVNAKLLIRAGFIRKEVAGVYNFLPLGLRVLEKIAQIVREEMNRAGGQEVLLSALQNRVNWVKTGRWGSFDVLFRVKSQFKTEYALGPTHEEVLVPVACEFIKSWRDLPQYLYQIQTKFRDEPRPKAGLLRGREFLMKDLYSFHTDEADMLKFYEEMKQVYKKTFARLGLETIETKAAGGTFSQFSHEFQVICPSGEDEIIYCPHSAHSTPLRAAWGKPGLHFSENTEISPKKEGGKCPACGEKLQKAKTIEVGNIFPLKDKFSQKLGLTFKDRNGQDRFVVMGCYGIGITRTMGAVVEVYHDNEGIIWPKSIAPYKVQLIVLSSKQEVVRKAEEIYQKLQKAGIEVLYDDRAGVTAGEKFADCDLIGISVRLVISEKTEKDQIEWKDRSKQKTQLLSIDDAISALS